MALIICPECGKEVSDRAAACPHCGCPVTEAPAQPLPSEPELHKNPEAMNPSREPFSKTIPWLEFFCITVIVLGLIGLCIPIVTHHMQQSTDTDTAYSQNDFHMTELPYSLDISGKAVPVERITFLELYANHGYTGYLVIAIDRRSLTAFEAYSLMKGSRWDWELDTSAWLSPHSIDSDNVSMNFLECYTTDDYIYHFYCTDLYQTSLAGSFVMTSIYYKPDGNFSDSLSYYYSFDFTEENYHNSIACLTSEERELLVKATAK